MSRSSSVRRQPTSDDFVVLLVEDTAELRRDAKRALHTLDGVYVVEAGDVDEATRNIDRYYVDAVIIDLELQGLRSAGRTVLGKLEERSSRAPVVIWSNHLGNSETVLGFVDDEQIIRAVDKAERLDQVTRVIEPLVERWHERRVAVVNDKFVRDLVWKRKDKGDYNLRKAQRELGRELDRVYRRLFGSVRDLEGEDALVTVTFRPIEREGLSAAVTVEAEVTIGRDANDKPVPGIRCVVKIGPVKEIEQELERYERFVKFGVRMAQRVELLGYAAENLIGGIAYSFAGGVFGHSQMSLDELLHRPEGWHLAAEAIKELFDPERKDWYGVQCKEVSPRDYMDDTYKTNFKDCFDELTNSLRGLQQKYSKAGVAFAEPGAETPGSFLFPGGELVIPPRNISGANVIAPERDACLVHGDMHGGNVMVELGGGDDDSWPASIAADRLHELSLKRVCLIDYRSAGPGPRAVDAVALQASIRLADAAAIAVAKAPRGAGGVARERPELTGKALEAAVIQAANRVQSEANWLEKAWQGPPDGKSVAREDSAPWAVASALLTARMRLTFKEMSLQEYLPIAILCAIRQFGYGVGPLVRVRILAWLSALYTACDFGQQ